MGEALAWPTEQEPTWGWLERASREIESEVGILDELIEEAAKDRKYGRAGYLEGVKRSMSSRQLIPFLASRNVLPKYGFPVDVVELNLARTGDPVASRIELARDLKMAIVDYAPGAVTVAGKKLWQSKGLVSRSDQNWPEYGWAVCDSCGHFRHAN